MKKKLLSNRMTIAILLILIIWCVVNLFIINGDINIRKYDAITVFFYVLAFSSLSMLQIIGPIFIMTACAYKFHKELHSGSIKNYLTRQKYKSYLKRIFKYSLKMSWILPVAMLILFIGCYFIAGNFDFSNAIPKIIGTATDGSLITSGTISPINLDFYATPIKLMVVFYLVLFLHSILYANISLIMCKKNKNMLVSIVSSFLVYIILNIVSEILLGKLFIKHLGLVSLNGIFNLFGIWVYCDFSNLTALVCYSLLLVLISYASLGITYKNKESVIIESEK